MFFNSANVSQAAAWLPLQIPCNRATPRSNGVGLASGWSCGAGPVGLLLAGSATTRAGAKKGTALAGWRAPVARSPRQIRRLGVVHGELLRRPAPTRTCPRLPSARSNYVVVYPSARADFAKNNNIEGGTMAAYLPQLSRNLRRSSSLSSLATIGSSVDSSISISGISAQSPVLPRENRTSAYRIRQMRGTSRRAIKWSIPQISWYRDHINLCPGCVFRGPLLMTARHLFGQALFLVLVRDELPNRRCVPIGW